MADGDHGVSGSALVATRPAAWPRRWLHPRQRSQLALVVEQHGAGDDAGVCRRLLDGTAARASAVRRHSAWARVYVSLDHHWSIRYSGRGRLQAFAGKEFIDYLARRGREDDADNFDWHVAYHPYPENLFEPRFWNDKSALPDPTTPRITFKNLEVLTEYLQRPELLYEGQPRRVILSEQGFHTPDGPAGEAIQAAAYCYAYRKIATLDGVDAFILHRHVDHPHEGGLRLGLRRYLPAEADPRPRKMIYECFRQADTARTGRRRSDLHCRSSGSSVGLREHEARSSGHHSGVPSSILMR